MLWVSCGVAAPPGTPYARYDAGVGISLDGSGHISSWSNQTATAHDLDRISAAASTTAWAAAMVAT